MAVGWLWWRAWFPVMPLDFAWQAWRLATLTFTLRGRRGPWRYRPSLCVAGVALMGLGRLWWRAPHTICHTQLCHTKSFTHTMVSHSHTPTLSCTISHTKLCHTHNCVTHNFVTHHLAHTTLSHTLFVTHDLSHAPLSHTLTPFHTHTALSHATLHIQFFN